MAAAALRGSFDPSFRDERYHACSPRNGTRAGQALRGAASDVDRSTLVLGHDGGIHRGGKAGSPLAAPTRKVRGSLVLGGDRSSLGAIPDEGVGAVMAALDDLRRAEYSTA